MGHFPQNGGRFPTTSSAFLGTFLGTLKSVYTGKGAFQSAQKSAENSVAPKRVLEKVQKIVLKKFYSRKVLFNVLKKVLKIV